MSEPEDRGTPPLGHPPGITDWLHQSDPGLTPPGWGFTVSWPQPDRGLTAPGWGFTLFIHL